MNSINPIMTSSDQWTDFRFTSPDGLRLAARQYGLEHRDNSVVVCLAGLSRNAADFHELAVHLSTRDKNPACVVAFDYRGRGQSDFDSNWSNYDVLVETGDVLAGLAAMDMHHADFIGTSRGGLITMALAAIRPGVLGRIVFNDIGPEVDGAGLMRIKNYVGKMTAPTSWQSARDMLRQTGEHAFTKWGDAEWDHQARLIFKEVDGKIVSRYDEALSKQMNAINFDAPLPNMWPQFAGLKRHQLLLLRGANSDLLSKETVASMNEIHPNMQAIEIPNQGHAPWLGDKLAIHAISTFLT